MSINEKTVKLLEYLIINSHEGLMYYQVCNTFYTNINDAENVFKTLWAVNQKAVKDGSYTKVDISLKFKGEKDVITKRIFITNEENGDYNPDKNTLSNHLSQVLFNDLFIIQ